MNLVAKISGFILFSVAGFMGLAMSVSVPYQLAYNKGQVESCTKLIPISPVLRVIATGCSINNGKLHLDLIDNSKLNLDELYDEDIKKSTE